MEEVMKYRHQTIARVLIAVALGLAFSFAYCRAENGRWPLALARWAVAHAIQLKVNTVHVCHSGECKISLSLTYDRARIPWCARWLAPAAIEIDENLLPWPALCSGRIELTDGRRNTKHRVLRPMLDRLVGNYTPFDDHVSLSGQTVVKIVTERPLGFERIQVGGWVDLFVRLPDSVGSETAVHIPIEGYTYEGAALSTTEFQQL